MLRESGNPDGLKVFISYPRGGYAHTWAEKIEVHLNSRGVATAWRDETAIDEGEQDWTGQLEEGVKQAGVLVCVLSADTEGSDWVKRELLTALELNIPIVVLHLEPVSLPYLIKEKQPVEHRDNDEDTLKRLETAVCREWQKHKNSDALFSHTSLATELTVNSLQREHERKWLGEILHVLYSDRRQRYVRIEGEQRQSRAIERVMKSERISTDAILKAFNQSLDDAESPQEKCYSDVLDAYRELAGRKVRRLAVLGEPGSGKSFSLERIALEYASAALKEINAPIPILVQLGRWTRDNESLQSFIGRSLGDLGNHFDRLKEQKRALLLLDGMNEIPPGQRRPKAQQIELLAQDERFACVVVSCREKDYQSDFKLPFDTLTLQPLKLAQIREFLHRAYSLEDNGRGQALSEARFWQIAGGEAVRKAWLEWKDKGGSFEQFWSVEDLEKELPELHRKIQWSSTYNAWTNARSDPRSLIHLASNPYMLLIMSVLPRLSNNRAELFKGFLELLYNREKEARERRHDAQSIPGYRDWLARLQTLAETLQQTTGTSEENGAQTALQRDQWPLSLDAGLLDFSLDASVLELLGDDLRFTHQLLQEYLASQVLVSASRKDETLADHYWPPDTWWERRGWEVVAEIAAESLNEQQALGAFIAWLARANPDLAAAVWQQRDCPPLPEKTLRRIRTQWFERMTNIDKTPHPYARAAIGRGLGRFGLDDRKGAGLRPDGLPAIDWVEIPGGPFIYQEEETVELPTFYISRYPVTNAQFQAFIDARGHEEKVLWEDLIKPEPVESEWKEANHPRTDMDWYEALAFTRWLTAQLGYEVRLPTEQEWEKGARGTQGLIYPWGNKYQSGHANINETWGNAGEWNLDQTTAVGLYPHGMSPQDVMDMAGNVWEWCLNKYDHPEITKPDTSGDSRVLRGGSWVSGAVIVRAGNRYRDEPTNRNSRRGLRVLSSRPIH